MTFFENIAHGFNNFVTGVKDVISMPLVKTIASSIPPLNVVYDVVSSVSGMIDIPAEVEAVSVPAPSGWRGFYNDNTRRLA